MAKIQLTLKENEIQLLSKKASLLGYTVSWCIKHLIATEALSTATEYLTYRMRQSGESQLHEALTEYKNGRSKS